MGHASGPPRALRVDGDQNSDKESATCHDEQHVAQSIHSRAWGRRKWGGAGKDTRWCLLDATRVVLVAVVRSETREAWNKNGMDAGGVLFFLVAGAVRACIYLMVLLLLLC